MRLGTFDFDHLVQQRNARNRMNGGLCERHLLSATTSSKNLWYFRKSLGFLRKQSVTRLGSE
jgi:hypothetical protein